LSTNQMMTEIASFIQGYLGDRQVKACLALRPLSQSRPKMISHELISVVCPLRLKLLVATQYYGIY